VDVATAFAVFLDSFTVIPSRRSISTRRQAGPLPVIHSDYLWHCQRRITDDFFIHSCSPTDALAAVRAYQPVPLHYLLVIDDQAEALAAYLAAGYQLGYTEYLMARSLADLPPRDARSPVRLIRGDDDAAQANAADAEVEPWVRPGNLESPTIYHYAIMLDGITAARARSWNYADHGSYITHVFTHPAYRRRGLARAVMLHLLHDCAARGETESLLVASDEGDLLYRSLGYERLARLLVLEPKAAA
jgi:ribosomal protein S18 acetylase RimI-like enzyme